MGQFDTERAAPDRPGVNDCCKTNGNLEWQHDAEKNVHIGTCKSCARKHYVAHISAK
jgi:hypothetical protein